MSAILIFLAVVMILAGIFAPSHVAGASGGPGAKIPKGLLLFTGLGFMIVGISSNGYYSVPAGYRGVLLQFGAVEGVLDEGAHFVMPFTQKVELMEVRTQKEEAQAAAASSDLQNVSARIAINYHLEPQGVGQLYKRVGPTYASRIIDPATQEVVKAVVANYTAEELVRDRANVKSKIDVGLSQRLAAYNIVVEPGGVSLTNFDFSDEFNKAIESKQVAQQTAEKQKYVLQQARMEAETAITKAKGEAEANRIKASALSSLGGSKVLAREWIDKWDGKLPTVASNGQGLMIDVRGLMDENKEEKPAGKPAR